jgi:hypothetical protein
MRPLASPVREHRLLGVVEVAIGVLFAIVAGILNPVEAAVGVLIGTALLGTAMSVALGRGAARRAAAAIARAPTEEREDTGGFARRIAVPVAAQVVVSFAVAAVARAPGLVAGVAFGAGVALLATSRRLERWEVARGVGLLREPGGATRAYYLAREER